MSYGADPSRFPVPTGRGSLLVHSALPPAGVPMAAAAKPPPPQHFSMLATHDDGTYFEVLEHDILAAQSRLAELDEPPPAASTGPSRHYSERELSSLRDMTPTSAAKLALHEVLSEKLMALERAAFQAARADGEEASAPRDASAPELSRLPALLGLVERLQQLARRPAPSAPSGGAHDTQQQQQAQQAQQAQQQQRAALLEANARCEALAFELREMREAAAAAAAAAADDPAAEARDQSGGAPPDGQAEALTAANARACVAEGEAERLRAELDRMTARVTRVEARLSESDAEVALLRADADAARAEALRLANVVELQERDVAQARAAAAKPAPAPPSPAAGDQASSSARAAEAEAEASRHLAAAALARSQVESLTAELDEMRGRLAAAEGADDELAAARASLRAEAQAREAAERRAEACARQVEHLERQGEGGDESFEAVLGQELRSMREAYEAKLAAAQEAERETALAHRRELRAAKEALERERRAAEARLSAVAHAPASGRGGGGSGALTAR